MCVTVTQNKIALLMTSCTSMATLSHSSLGFLQLCDGFSVRSMTFNFKATSNRAVLIRLVTEMVKGNEKLKEKSMKAEHTVLVVFSYSPAVILQLHSC